MKNLKTFFVYLVFFISLRARKLLMEIRDKIIKASTEQFMHYGIKSVTMDDIAAGLGMSKRTIYEHFTNKKELLRACCRGMNMQMEEKDQQIIQDAETIVDELVASFGQVDEHYNQQGKFVSDIKKFYPELFEEEFCAHYEHAYSNLKNRLERGIAQGIIKPDINLDFAVYMILETMFNVVTRPERIIKMQIHITAAFKYITIYLFRGLSTDKGIALIDSKMQTLNIK